MRLMRGIGSAPCVAWCARRSRVRSCMGCSAIIIVFRGLGVSAVWWVVLCRVARKHISIAVPFGVRRPIRLHIDTS